jgi:4-hydroxybenzoyl-CoA thioesterase
MFEKEKLIRFQHCDPAGIVFYPQYIIMFHELMEDWFNEGLGGDYADFVIECKMGLPIVKLECEFLAPNVMGAILTMRLEVKRIGISSITLGISARSAGRECVRATLTVVHTSLTEMKPVSLPETLRAAMLKFQYTACLEGKKTD